MKMINLTVNGIKRQVVADDELVLLDLLRNGLKLTGTKQSCDRKGQCGACTVVVNKKAVRSCLTKVANLEGADVITVEGLGTPDNPHLIQEAFVLAGAIQCGFCTPAMIMAAKALLDVNPNPSVVEIKKAYSRILCRCTGYKKIIEAVQLAGRFMRKETSPARVRRTISKTKAVGVSHPRPTAMVKACGVAQFGADIHLENALELAVVYSTEFHANIKKIEMEAAKAMSGVVGIMTAADIKGTNRLRMTTPDWPVLCENRVRTLGDPIAIVAAQTRDQARAAAAAVKVEYEKLPVTMMLHEAMAPGTFQIHNFAPGNLAFSRPLIKGDANKAFSEAKCVVEGEFSTQTVHQSPMEPEVSLAYLDGEGASAQLVVVGRSIWIHFHANQLKEALGWPNIRYKEPFAGGQFGIKLAITTEAVAAAAALHFKRAVRCVPSMAESMFSSTKRMATIQKIKIGADSTGRIIAFSDDFTFNKGAYSITSPGGNINRSIGMLSSSYNFPNISAIGRSVYTNNASGGAARGAGPPETNFGVESTIDMLAEKMAIDPLEFRRMNSLKPGETKATGMVAKEWSYLQVCDALQPHYNRAKKDAADFNLKPGPVRRGVGIGGMSFGIGDPTDNSSLSIELNPDNTFTVYAAVADPGEGNDAMLSQIAAEKLGCSLDRIKLYTRDTDKTVYMGPAAGSRMTLMAGNALVNAIDKLNKAMEEANAKTYEGLVAAGKPTRFEGATKNPGNYGSDPKTGLRDAFITDVHNLQMAEVEVNTETGETTVLKITSVIDAGTIINPQAIEGQLEGGMDQGVGYALREEYIHGKTTDYVKFKFPTIQDSFDMEIIKIETPRSNGPLGATGIGEMTMCSTAPAVTNAINNACGVRICNLPATPEKVKAALAAKG